MNGLLLWFRQTHVLQRTAFLLALVMMAHGFDTCSAHLAGIAKTATTLTVTAQAASLESCDSGEQICEKCLLQESHGDICEVTSDTALMPSGEGFELAPPVLIGLPLDIVIPKIPDIIDLMPISGVISSRAGPDVPALSSTLCRNPLLGRAPPLSA